MAVHKSQPSLWVKNNTQDIMNNITFWEIYNELKNCAYDTGLLVSPEVILQEELPKYVNDTTSISFIDLNFHKLKNGVLDTFYYFNFDTVNNILTDNPSRSISPYKTNTIFTFSPIKQQFNFKEVTFHFIPSLFFIDSANYAFKETGIYKIDFGDGQGWQVINPLSSSHFKTINYPGKGVYTLKLGFFSHINVLEKYAESKIQIENDIQEPKPLHEVNIDDELTAGYYPPCADYSEPAKIIIYLTGFRPIDFLGKNISKIYHDKIEGNQLKQLQNHGYSFYVLSYKTTHVGVESNAMLFVKFLDHLKSIHPHAEPFIVMGSSMGAMVTRYALTYMETENYLQDPKSIAPEKMHNTRLWISIDAPHQGFNIPAALQNYINKYQTTWPHSPYLDAFNFFIKKGLNSQTAKELMANHNSAINGINLAHTPQFDSLFSKLHNLNLNTNGYPEFCKKMAISQGLGTGENQIGVNKYSMQGNDTLFYIKNQLINYVPIYFPTQFTSVSEDLLLKTSSLTNSTIYTHNIVNSYLTLKIKRITKTFLGFPYPAPKIYYVKSDISANLGSLTTSGSNLDYIAGGNYSFVDKVKNYDDGGFTGFFIHNNNGTQSTVNWPLSINYPTGTLGNISISSQSWGFNTCAVASALDYNDGLNTSNPDFRGMNVGTIMSRTPFDIIVAEPEFSKHFTHGKYTNHTLDGTPWHHLQSNNDTCRYLNREIGEDILFLNNYTTPPGVDFQFSATYDIVLGTTENELYNYSNQSQNFDLTHKLFQGNSDFANKTIFSKSNPFTLNTNSTAKFIAGNGITQNSWTNLGHWDEIQVQFLPCYPDYGTANKGGATLLANITTEQAIQVYPNPSQSGYFTVTNPNEELIEFYINDATGRRIYTNQFSSNSFTTENLLLSNGIYFITINKVNGQNQTFKIIVQH